MRRNGCTNTARERLLEGRASEMRWAPTLEEAKLFEAIRGKRLGVAFRRQVTLLGRYIADFLAPEVRLIVEVDGGYHSQRQRADKRRDKALAKAGYRTLRLPNELVMSDLPEALRLVSEAVEAIRGQ